MKIFPSLMQILHPKIHCNEEGKVVEFNAMVGGVDSIHLAAK